MAGPVNNFQTISVNQGATTQLGTDFPFTSPPAGCQFLLGDLWLSYNDDDAAFTLPLRVTRLLGFGNATAPHSESLSEGQSESLSENLYIYHDQDVVIEDSVGNVVFNTSQSDVTFIRRAWGNNLNTCTWIKGESVLRLTYRNFSPPWQPGIVWADDIRLNAVLDARTYQRLPARVRSITVGDTKLTGTPIVFQEGYNVDLSLSSPPAVEGGRNTTQLTIQAQPGDGLGLITGCGDTTPPILTINNTPPDSGGNFIIDADTCYRIQRPTEVIGTEPREVSLYAETLSSEDAQSALQLFMDCGPCCSCDDFVQTYNNMRSLFDQYADLGIEAESARDTLQANINRWNAQAACRANNNIRLVLNAERGGTLFVGGLYCNNTGGCVVPMILRATFEYFGDGSPVDVTDATALCRENSRSGTDTKYAQIPYAPLNHWPVIDTIFNLADPQSVSQFRNRWLFPSVGATDTVRVSLSMHSPPIYNPVTGASVPLPTQASLNIPSSVLALWADDPAPYPAHAFIQVTSPVSETAGCCA